MLYYILRPWIYWFGCYFFSKTYFTGMDKLPSGQPLILACNHPTAFTEPAYIGSSTLKAQNFMLRGDMFSGGKGVDTLLRSIKCIPIYRAQDGMANLKKNEAILDYCYKLLNEGNNLFILSEGESKLEKRLRPIQKGTARMAFGAYEKYGRKDIVVVPIGINYMDANQFRSKIYADFGEPIPIATYFEAHEKNPRRAVKLLTDRIRDELRERVIHVEKEEDDVVADQLLKLIENDHRHKPFPMISTKPSLLPQFIRTINNFNGLEETEKASLTKNVSHYFDKLKNLGIKDIGVAQTRYASFSVFLALLIGFIPYLIGVITNFIPTELPKFYADRNVQQVKFYGSVRIAIGTILYFAYFLIALIIAAIFGTIWHLLFVLSFPLFGLFKALWIEYAGKFQAAWKVKRLEQSLRRELYDIRGKLLAAIKGM